MTPLMTASANGHYEVVEWLLDNGGKVLLRDKFKRNAVILAIMNGNVRIASVLLQQYITF